TPSGQSIVDGCFAGNTAFCPNIIRIPDPNNPSNLLGRIQTVITSPQNIASEKVAGIDLESSYRFAMADVVDSWDGDLSLRFLANFVLKTESFNPTLPANQFVDGKGVLGGFAVSGYSGRTNPD